MRILITGGAGFIGSHVADACVADGHAVWVVDDLSSGSQANVGAGVRLCVADIRDAESMMRVIAEVRPDAISHHAAQVSVAASVRAPQGDARTNVEGTLNVLEAAARHGVRRFVFASTGGAIYGEVAAPGRAAVGDPPRPRSPYACGKLAAEGYLEHYRHAHGLASTVLRYTNVYGPRQDPHGEAGVVAIFGERLLAGRPLRIHGRRSVGDEGCVRDYVFVGDVVRANQMALAGAITEPVVHVCTGVGTTTRALASGLAAALGVTAEIENQAPRAGDVERSVLTPWAGLGPVVGLDEGLRATAAWWRGRPGR